MAGLRIGYARVSTDDQNLVLQQYPLGATGCLTVCEENASSVRDVQKYKKIDG
jgi:DNA invertase Pin-like site-specific DNA recombinase